MGVESATYISDLDPNAPAGGDSIAQGDDHLRLIKETIKNTFKEVKGEVTATHDDLNQVPALLNKKNGVFASCRHDGSSLLYGQNISGVTPVAGTAGYKVTFDQPTTGFDQYYSVLCQPYATNGKHVVVTVTGQTSTSVDITMLEFDFPSQTWQVPENPIGFSLVTVDMQQV